MRADRAYKCSRCGRWIPREGHAGWCSRVAPAANDKRPQSTGFVHNVPTGSSHRCGSSESTGTPVRVNHMGTNHEVEVRLAAARTWLDHALAGECSPAEAVQAVEGLCEAVRAFEEGRA